MWAEYNYTSFPIVEVNMKGVVEKEEDFDHFLKEWSELYSDKRDFVFIFDTREVGWISPKYAFKMASFITTLKKQNKQYLKRSSIIVDSIWVRSLLRLIFAMQSPVCPIDYHSSEATIDLEMLMEEANKDLKGGLVFGLDSRT